jgi:transcriptional regulator with XRE-family HTH domain
MNLDARKKLAQVIRNSRGKDTLTIYGRKINVSYAAVSKWENLESIPSMENLEKIGNLAGYSLEEFMQFLEGKKSEPSKIDVMIREIREMAPKQLVLIDRAVADRFYAIAESVG